MTFRISGLSPEPFQALFGLPDQALAALWQPCQRCLNPALATLTAQRLWRPAHSGTDHYPL